MSTPDNTFPDQEQVYESDTLLVLNDKKNVRAVKATKDGELETVSPTSKNSGQFIRVDRNGDIFTNFFSNFLRQLKDPSRFTFFKVPHEQAIEKAAKIQKYFTNPTVGDADLIKKFEISNEFIKQVLEMQASNASLLEGVIKNQQQINNQIMETQQNNTPRYSADEVDWEKLATYGVTKEQLEKKKQLDTLLKGFRTTELFPVNFKFGSHNLRCDARLSLQRDDSGNVNISFHGIRKQRNLDFEFLGHQFTEEDKKNLKSTGNMGRTVNLQYLNGDIEPSVISVDRLTNELVAYKAKYIKIPDEIKQVRLTEEQKQILMEGKPLRLEGMISSKGEPFDGNVQFNADKRYVEFLFDRSHVSQQIKGSRDEMSQSTNEIPRIFRGKELSEEQYSNLKAGETVYIDGLVDKNEKAYQGYITYNANSGKIDFQFPNQAKQQTNSAQKEKTDAAATSEVAPKQSSQKRKEQSEMGQNDHGRQRQDNPQKEANKRGRGRKMS